MALVASTRQVLSNTLYPILLALPLCAWIWLWKYLDWDAGNALMVVYWTNLAFLFFLEQLIPFEREWRRNDGQIPNDLLFSLGGVFFNSAATVVCLAILTWAIETIQPLVSLNIWPIQWPFFAQVVVGIVLWDLGNHLAHRWAHKISFLWRFHSVHHAAPRLSVINTGRLHPVDVVKSVIIGAPLPVLLGVPAEVSLWYAAFNVFVGMLTHSNLDLRCGVFNWFLSTPNLHRWHHSPHRIETDTNFGEATMVWDRLFGTYFNPARRPPRNVGLGGEVRVSARFLEQLLQPLTPKGHHASEANVIRELLPGAAGPGA
jgi:sterol desaturase/sphingolipid hydroxylase (fatty acid hydroxylase superfamily)